MITLTILHTLQVRKKDMKRKIVFTLGSLLLCSFLFSSCSVNKNNGGIEKNADQTNSQIDSDTNNNNNESNNDDKKDFVWPDPEYDDVFRYQLREDNTYSISPIDKTSLEGDLIIPETFNDKKVTIIEGNSFTFCDKVTSVSLSENIKKIGFQAFMSTKVGDDFVISDSVIELGNSSFLDCGIKKLSIGSGVKDLPYGCFALNPIEEITIGDNVKTMSQPFHQCHNLKAVNIGKSLETISYGAFQDCENLEVINVDSKNEYFVVENHGLFSKDKKTIFCLPAKIDVDNYILPNETEMIEMYAFNRTSIKQITFGEHLKAIGYDAFKYSTSLNQVSFNNELETIDQGAFSFNTALEEIVLPNSVTNIGNSCFACNGLESSLTKVVLPNNLQIIGQGVFLACDKLVDFVIPSSVTKIESKAFFDSINDFNYEGTVEEWSQIDIANNWSNKLGEITIHCSNGIAEC